jgi:hypothetical protein
VSIRRMLTVLVAVCCIGALSASPASAERLPEGPGKPALTGRSLLGEDPLVVVHCQTLMELFGLGTFPPGTYPGVVFVTANSPQRVVGPPNNQCPLAE